MGRIRVIVAEGPDGLTAPSGLLRAVLEREGVEIAGEVGTASELIQLAADELPDAVVFATRVPQEELDRLRRVTPSSKIVFVSSIVTAAQAELAEAVVERADVLASLGPVLVHLCTPGRVNARRALTEGFDRPDWIDRVRKDPVTLREILSEHGVELDERPSVTSLQGEARAGSEQDDLVVLPDLEAGDAGGLPTTPPDLRETVAIPDAKPEPEPEPDARPEAAIAIQTTKPRRRRRFGLWAFAFVGAAVLGAALLPPSLPTG
jgi:hypothetical protein